MAVMEEQETRREAKVSRRSRRGGLAARREQQEIDWNPMILSWGYEDPAVMVREMLVISGDPGRAKKGDLAFRMLLPWLIYLIQGKLPYPILDITLNRDI